MSYEDQLNEWMERQKMKLHESKMETRRATDGRQCRHCRFGRAHPYSDKYFYCAKFRSTRTPCGMAKTLRTNTCDHWEPK